MLDIDAQGSRPCRSRLLAIAAIAVAILALPAAAQAKGLYVQVTNNTKIPFKVFVPGDNCWDDKQLLFSEAPQIDAGAQQVLLYTRAKEEGSCSSTDFSNHYAEIDLAFRRPDGTYSASDAAIAGAEAAPYSAGEGDWEIQWDGTMRWHGTPRGWYPVSPARSGTSGGGLFCVKTDEVNYETVSLVVKAVPNCFAQGSSRSASAARAGAKPSPRGVLAGGQQVVYDVFQLGKSACDLLGPPQPWGGTPCATAADASQWDLHNVTTDVKDAKADTDPQTVEAVQQIGKFTQVNNTDSEGQLEYSVTYRKGHEERHATTRGDKVGGSLEKEIKIPLVGDITATFTYEHEWTDTKEQVDNGEQEATVRSSIPTRPRGTTTLYVFQGQGQLGFNFSANLTAGLPNTAQPLKTPMTRPMGLSPARRQPCIGYLAGSADQGSIMGLGRLAASRGLSPETVGLPADQRAFLESVPGFSVSGSDHCPGFPDGYPGQMAFKGTGYVKAHAGGGGDDPNWAPNLGEIKYCPYYKPFSGGSAPPGSDLPDPCATSPDLAGSTAVGLAIDGADHDPGDTVRGTVGGNLILADGQRDLGPRTRYLGRGGNDVLQGARFGDHMLGGDGADFASGEGGSDELHGGRGQDALNGGSRKDVLEDTQGRNALFGGAGADRLASGGSALGGLLGQGGDDTLVLRDRSQITLQGGPGDDTYKLLGGAPAKRITEFPRQGRDTIETESSQHVPLNVEKARAMGAHGVTLTAGIGDQTLVGGRGNDVLRGGAGADRVNGRGGDDRLRLATFGFDRARGGAGADRFYVLNKRPPDASFGISIPTGLPRSANAIDDLHPGRGDRLVLSVKRFGKPLAKLRGHQRVTYGRHATGGRAQFVYNRHRQLLWLDPDGRGGVPPTAVAILEGHDHVPTRAIHIVG